LYLRGVKRSAKLKIPSPDLEVSNIEIQQSPVALRKEEPDTLIISYENGTKDQIEFQLKFGDFKFSESSRIVLPAPVEASKPEIKDRSYDEIFYTQNGLLQIARIQIGNEGKQIVASVDFEYGFLSYQLPPGEIAVGIRRAPESGLAENRYIVDLVDGSSFQISFVGNGKPITSRFQRLTNSDAVLPDEILNAKVIPSVNPSLVERPQGIAPLAPGRIRLGEVELNYDLYKNGKAILLQAANRLGKLGLVTESEIIKISAPSLLEYQALEIQTADGQILYVRIQDGGLELLK
jgi:hypothetical protein